METGYLIKAVLDGFLIGWGVCYLVCRAREWLKTAASAPRDALVRDDGSAEAPAPTPPRTERAGGDTPAERQERANSNDVGHDTDNRQQVHADIVPQTQEAENVSLGEVPATCAELSDMLLNLLKVGMTEDAKKNLIKADGSMADNACLLLAISYSFTRFVHTYAPSQASKSLSDSKIALVKVIGKLIDGEQEGDLCHTGEV